MSLGRVAFVVLGCAKNQVEAESMSSRLARDGWDLTADIPNANLVVVHSCGFLDAARQEARDTLGNVRRASPKASVVLTGCFAQYLNGRRLPGVDAILGTGQFDRLPAVLEGLRRKRSAPPAIPRSGPAGYHDASRPRPLPPGQLSAYVRISEGCNHRCTFCVIPQLRGSLKSRPPGDIFAEARDLTDRGVRELVLISQDTTDYGRDTGRRLPFLIEELASWPKLDWLRLLYAYPSEVDDALIALLAGEPKLLGYLDMPLQHIADPVLKAMARDSGEKETRRLLDRLVKRVPGLALRTTFIVGFPGETDADFRRLEKLVDTGVFEHVGVFPYSFEPRSPSARLPGLVPTEVVNERWQRLLDAHRRVKAKRDAARIGRPIAVLVERGPAGWSARAAHQAPEVDGGVRLARWPRRPGLFAAAVTGVDGFDLKATLKKSAEAPVP
ncbi:MAG: 30S ribosomal protein S12 methylthiotransferase RimO [Elusimicrobia bacterium]|jgi:ribosomal protein S12 methylthiotransferase|nr:30S ribosomal protein S12 methylthiotransferase RimO [Elusimicrobiota bacterium]